MKRLITITTLLLAAASLKAQPWMQRHPSGTVNVQEVIDEHKANPGAFESEEEEEQEGPAANREQHDYLFDRWAWYAKQHTDEQGNLVSPLKTYQEWVAYQQAAGSTASKGVGVISNWTFQGPTIPVGGATAGLGRIQVIAFHPTDSNTYWVGTAGGGAWRTTNNGLNWTCMTDMLTMLGAADIVYNPLNPQVIYLCTGDRDGNDNNSIGLLKSTDGGATWNTTGLVYTPAQGRDVTSIIVNPSDTSSLLLATSVGIYKSNNSGTTWSLVKNGSYKQIFYRPADSMVAYAASANTIIRTADGGLTWNTSLTVQGTSRLAIAVSPAAPKNVKAVVANAQYGLEGIYSSNDTGKTFVKIFSGANCANNILNSSSVPGASSCDGQGWYDLAIAYSLTDSNKLFVGGVNTWQSSNGGSSWTLVNQAYGGAPGVVYVHPDKHFLAYQPTRPNTLFEGNDGGIYRTTSPTTVWNNISTGLGITQFYRNAVASNAAFVLGGAQDNGTKYLNTATGAASQASGGDGMNCEIDWSNANIYYTASQYGSLNRYTNGAYFSISNTIPGQPQGDWITPFIISPADPAILFAGYTKVYISRNRGSSWTDYSPVFSGANMQRLATSLADTASVYALINNSLRVTHNSGATWATMQVPASTSVSDITVEPKDGQHLWLTLSGYGTNKVLEYDTVNGWRVHNTGLPNVPVNCVVIDSSNNTKYVGTDVAVFRLNDTTNTWELYSTGLPAAQVRDLGINYTTDEIWAATYGRGMWRSPKYTPPVVVPTSVNMIPLAMDVITVSPNPSDGRFTITTNNASLKGRSAGVSLVDMAGRTVMQSQQAFDAGGNMTIATQSIARGTYMLQVTGSAGLMARTKVAVY